MNSNVFYDNDAHPSSLSLALSFGFTSIVIVAQDLSNKHYPAHFVKYLCPESTGREDSRHACQIHERKHGPVFFCQT